MRLRTTACVAAVSAGILMMAGYAGASVMPIVTVQVGDGTEYTVGLSQSNVVDNADGTTTVAKTWTRPGDGATIAMNLLLDPDPSVTASFNIQNLTASTQTYTVSVTLPVSPVLVSPTNQSGSVGLTVTNDGVGGATGANAAPDALYTALIDGSSVHTLMVNPFALNVPLAFDSNTVSEKFGIPSPVSGGAVASSIGIRLHFTLTGGGDGVTGDQAGITSVFTVNPVPEPATMGIMGMGLAALAARRRR